jgi:hypothetical protein
MQRPHNTSLDKPESILEPQVFIDYLGLYDKYRYETRNQPIGKIKYFAGMILAAATSTDPADEAISKIFGNVISDLNTTKSFDEWYELIFKLRDLAEACKKEKYSSALSLSWLTLHALADFIIRELYRVSDNLKLKIAEIKGEIARLEAINDSSLEDINDITVPHLKKQRQGRQGKGVAKNNQDIQALVLKLAMLGDAKYINHAVREHLIDHMQVTNAEELRTFNATETGNYAAPLCLQRGLCRWVYENYYQSKTNIDFPRFIQNSLLNGLITHQKQVLKEKDAIKTEAKVQQAYLDKEREEMNIQLDVEDGLEVEDYLPEGEFLDDYNGEQTEETEQEEEQEQEEVATADNTAAPQATVENTVSQDTANSTVEIKPTAPASEENTNNKTASPSIAQVSGLYAKPAVKQNESALPTDEPALTLAKN